jgi:DNA-binding response OmpR family regulator/signal transduction histidine kinase
MPNQNITILLIESDPQTQQLIADQSLRPVGYQVEVTDSTSSGLQEIEKLIPNLIITNLNLPGLSGKDLIVALASRWITTPIIVMASKGQETDILQALRLGAADYLLSPIRETEVISVVENTLRKQHVQIALEKTAHQLGQVKADMLKQARDFMGIFTINRLLLKAENMPSIYQEVCSTVIQIGEAERAWILTLDPKQCKYILQACSNTSEEMQAMINLPYEDEFSALAGVSGHAITLHGEALNRFNNPELLGAAIVVPIKQNNKSIGTITVTKRDVAPFTNNQQAMLELAAEYTSLLEQTIQRFMLLEHSLVVEQQSCVYQRIEAEINQDILSQASLELRNPLKMLAENVKVLFTQEDYKFNRDKAIALRDILEEAQILTEIADGMVILNKESDNRVDTVNLNEIAQQVVDRYRPFTIMDHINFNLELAAEPALVKAYPTQMVRVIEGLVSNALKYSPPRGEISIEIESKEDHYVVSVKNLLENTDELLTQDLFDKKKSFIGYTGRRFGGIGISLPVINKIIAAYKGQIWAKKGTESDLVVSFTLPRL